MSKRPAVEEGKNPVSKCVYSGQICLYEAEFRGIYQNPHSPTPLSSKDITYPAPVKSKRGSIKPSLMLRKEDRLIMNESRIRSLLPTHLARMQPHAAPRDAAHLNYDPTGLHKLAAHTQAFFLLPLLPQPHGSVAKGHHLHSTLSPPGHMLTSTTLPNRPPPQRRAAPINARVSRPPSMLGIPFSVSYWEIITYARGGNTTVGLGVCDVRRG